MLPSKAFLPLIWITLSAVDASPLSRHSDKQTLSFARHINQLGTLTIIEKDRARVQAMKQASHPDKRSSSFSVTNAGVTYTAQVGIGEPPSYYALLIDTGSSNTFSVTYGSGAFFGEEWLDTVTLSPALVINRQSIGVANSSIGFQNIDGILGVGPIDLTKGTVSNISTVPTVMDNLFAQGTISEAVLGVYFVPVSEPTSDGELTFGGYDPRVTTGPMNYVPLTTTSPASEFWGVDASISYGGTPILSSTAGIVDTGTTLILIATDAYQKYESDTGATMDFATGLLSLNSSQYSSLNTLTFDIGGNSYDLTPNAQIWPRSLNTEIGGSSSSIYLIVGDIGNNSGSGLDFVAGYCFLERYYSVYDTTNNRVGFAMTAYTQSTSN
ncbi:acid protease [Chiua virens]|nr:acid protease [Chiua virens]